MNRAREESAPSGALPSRVHALVSGLVQGVNYRAATRRQAETLGVTGWVRNLADGRVELVAEGSRAALEGLLEWCRQGPPWARVDGVQVVEWGEPTGEFPRFGIGS